MQCFNKENLIKFFQWIDKFNWVNEIENFCDEKNIKNIIIEIRVNENNAIYADDEFIIKVNIENLNSETIKNHLIQMGYIDKDFNFYENIDNYNENLYSFHIVYDLTNECFTEKFKYELCIYWYDEIEWERYVI